ncbi:MAG: dockerin type I domain-containing protein [Candidatus Methanoperedens sp.]|nr:dockerin type I domain-containing protein [Candidatus Methanoperedens sp.]
MSARPAYGRWNGTAWVYDSETSPAIGAGDPANDNSRSTWGGRIEMGAYGNTAEASRPPVSISGTAAHVNLTVITSALVSLYTQAGTPYNSNLSAANGTFQFNNVPDGSYYVNVSKAGYALNHTPVFTVSAGSAVNTGTLTLQYYDLNGDGMVNILDLNSIVQHLGEITHQPYPVYDVNGDGVVNDSDLDIVEQHLDISS